jgi:MFS transporter, ACDE family, multidrug resistance protein
LSGIGPITSDKLDWRIAAVVLGAPIAVLSGMQLILPVLPVIQAELGLSEAQISLVSSVYLLPGVLLAIPAGLLGDRIGRRLMFGWSLVLFGAAGLFLWIRNDFSSLLAGRFVQGLAFAVILPLTITMIGELWRSHGQLRNQGMRVVGMNVANVVWPLIGGIVAVTIWQVAFLFQALALPLGIAALLALPDDSRSLSGTRGRVRVKLIQMMRTRRALAVECTAFLRFLVRFGFLTYGPILLVSYQGFSPFETGLVIGAAAFVATVAAGITGAIARRVRPSLLLRLSAVGMASGLALISVGGAGAWAGALLYGFADGVFAVVHSGFMTEAVPASIRAAFVATTGAIKNTGKFLAPTLVVILLGVLRLDAVFLVLSLLVASMIPMAGALRDLDGGLQPAARRP